MSRGNKKPEFNNEPSSTAEDDGRFGRSRPLAHWRVVALYLIIFDIIAINAAYFLALLFRFDFNFSSIPEYYLFSFVKFTPFYTVFSIIVFWCLRLYHSLWRYTGFNELGRVLAASGITTLFQVVGITVFVYRMPVSYYCFGAIFQLIFIVAVRFGYRYVSLERVKRERAAEPLSRAMIIGAGEAGQAVIRELARSDHSEVKPVCIIDDNPNKWNRYMEGIPIAGGRGTILENAEKYNVDKILLAIPTMSAKDKKEILEICTETGCEIKSLPGIYQLANGEVTLNKLRPVSMEDLLGRDPISVDMGEIFNDLQGKTILVTGGGGSIGSELCRQIAAHAPRTLLLFDVYENNAYLVEQELKRKYPDITLRVLIGSVRDSRRIEEIFALYRPDIVYHAAAHKHVPLMEENPNEAIKNNVIGTYKTACAALRYGTDRFVLISTDKAVNPTNIMGASKRLCEMIIQMMDKISQVCAIHPEAIDLLPALHAHIDEKSGRSVSLREMNGDPHVLRAQELSVRQMRANGTEDGESYIFAGGGVLTGKEGSSENRSGGNSDQRYTIAYAGTGDTGNASAPGSAAQAAAGRRRASRYRAPHLMITDPGTDTNPAGRTRFVAVRFGNVLGSSGSVIPLFQKQIEQGGPVTVTHPEITRYFMTISEAVSLVLQAGVYAKGGEIFVLDMGEPVKIDTLARNLIRLSGYKPDEDIEIRYIGLRPGEKLYEEKLMAEEGMKKTANDLIYIGSPIDFNIEKFLEQLVELAECGYKNAKDIKQIVARMVPTYTPE